MSRKLLLAPHNDDEALFAAFTIMREQPLVAVVTDSWLQYSRGQGITSEQRWAESVLASKVLGHQLVRVGLRDDTVTEEAMVERFKNMFANFGTVYAPAEQGGNLHHDMVARAAKAVFPHVVQYTTYTRTELWTQGSLEIVPTAEELNAKNHALECYETQLEVNRPHFDAVFGRSEWYL